MSEFLMCVKMTLYIIIYNIMLRNKGRNEEFLKEFSLIPLTVLDREAECPDLGLQAAQYAREKTMILGV